jgi:capsular polysaccharide export protein
VFAWSYSAPPDLSLFCERHGIPLTYVEDGFIRSVGLGADRTAPASLVFDDMAMHFDRLRPSRLEVLLATYDFDGDTPLMDAATRLAALMLEQGLSKYMFTPSRKVAEVLELGSPRVLVLGQVEDDLSIRYGAESLISGNQLVMQAAQENPGAQILYRPHPESLAYAKPHYSNPALVSDVCTVLGPEFSIGDCMDSADRVYTVTSLAGFEAALRGKPVVTMGAPFYSSWGFTEDRLQIGRRTRHLTPLQVLAGAYLLYPRYAGVEAEGSAKVEQVMALVANLASAKAR